MTLGTVIAADLMSVAHVLSLDAALADVASVAVAFAGTAIVVHSLRRRLSAILAESERHAHQDHLTGLANRRAFSAALDAALAHRTRTDEPLSLVTVDVDDFKEVNDTRGHAAGDAVLRQVTAALRSSVRRGGDTVARLGGDEFVALLRGAIRTMPRAWPNGSAATWPRARAASPSASGSPRSRPARPARTR